MVSDPLEEELLVLVNNHVDLENQTQILQKAASALN